MNKFIQLDNKTLYVISLLTADFILKMRKSLQSSYLAKIVQSQSKLNITTTEIQAQKLSLISLLKNCFKQYAQLEDLKDTSDLQSTIRNHFPPSQKHNADKIQVIIKCIEDCAQKWKQFNGFQDDDEKIKLLANHSQNIVEQSDGLKWRVEYISNFSAKNSGESNALSQGKNGEINVVVSIQKITLDGQIVPERIQMSVGQFQNFAKEFKQAVGYL